MPTKLPTILDNADSQTVLESLKRLLPEAKSLDVATGYFEIGSLLALESFWNKFGLVRIITGDETTRRTRRELVEALGAEVDESAWQALCSTVSQPFEKPKTGKIAVKVINHYGDEAWRSGYWARA